MPTPDINFEPAYEPMCLSGKVSERMKHDPTVMRLKRWLVIGLFVVAAAIAVAALRRPQEPEGTVEEKSTSEQPVARPPVPPEEYKPRPIPASIEPVRLGTERKPGQKVVEEAEK